MRRMRLAGVLVAIGLAASLTMAGTGTAHADPVPPTSTWAEIFNPHLNAQGITLCVDDPGGSLAILQKIQLFRCHGYANPNSDFQLEFLIGYPFVNSWCMAASNFTDSNSTRLVNERCESTDTRQLGNLG